MRDDASVDPALVTRLTAAVQAALEADATARVQSGRDRLERSGQQALAVKVCRDELVRIDTESLSEGRSPLDSAQERSLIGRVLALAVGLGPVELILVDPTVEEIVATRFDLVFVYRSDGSVEQLTERLWATEAEMVAWLSHLARTAGRTERQFNSQCPQLVMRLGDGLRLAASRDVSQHVTFALRRNTLGKVTLADLVGLEMFPEVIAEFLAACMRGTELRLVFSGPTGSGKSTMVRACMAEFGPLTRVVIIEDTAELDFFDPALHPNVESWEERLANNEGEGHVSPKDNVRHSLRYRPDWLVYGEVRSSDAAVPMLQAMTHGQSSLTTVHSPSAIGALDKLALYLGTGEDKLPREVAHDQLSQAVDFVIHLDRLPGGKRVVSEIVEVAGYDGTRCTTNTILGRDGSGRVSITNRLTGRHSEALRRAGFDDTRLGGGLR